MQSKIRALLGAAALAFTLQALVHAQDAVKQENKGTGFETGTFHGHGILHKTSGRATIYQESDGKLILRLTNFKTSHGPDLHVILVAVNDASADRIELGKLKGNEGDQNYEIPSGTDLSKFQTVSIYCERFSANFGEAPLEKF